MVCLIKLPSDLWLETDLGRGGVGSNVISSKPQFLSTSLWRMGTPHARSDLLSHVTCLCWRVIKLCPLPLVGYCLYTWNFFVLPLTVQMSPRVPAEGWWEDLRRHWRVHNHLSLQPNMRQQLWQLQVCLHGGLHSEAWWPNKLQSCHRWYACFSVSWEYSQNQHKAGPCHSLAQLETVGFHVVCVVDRSLSEKPHAKCVCVCVCYVVQFALSGVCWNTVIIIIILGVFGISALYLYIYALGPVAHAF